MKRYIFPAIRLTIVLIVLLAGVYPLLIAAVAKLAPGKGDGITVTHHGKVVGYANVGQTFTEDKYFWSRPSAVDYNAGGSGGSNKGPANPAYLAVVQARIDTFLAHNPGVQKADIPAELVTASGSGLDPDLSPAAAEIQIPRIARERRLPESRIRELVKQYTNGPLLGFLGPSKVNVLQLNIALDDLK
ncbi:K(+)-transporting ATPase subunit C [Chitinophaga japonensis]|uniref:Potassium-transporting ATPase KdpC subunit n=1 Tax=Chitinophaga japonensis TaxID=104662 RepID=A0A562TEP8_CHIJA|nr:K(+)-transporting ATPase subunit C [Chitinophaga japonensis]TWI91576.1 K+-transporting ATPase ATPase C chain [Chitinophaga japonensis]